MMELFDYWVRSIAAWLQWDSAVAYITIVAGAALLIDVIQRQVMRWLRHWVKQTKNIWDDAVLGAVAWPLSLLIWLTVFILLLGYLPDSNNAALLDQGLLVLWWKLGAIVALAWFLIRLVRGIENNVIKLAAARSRAVDATTIHALGRVTRVVIVVVAILIVMDTLEFRVSGLLAAGGIGGIALGLAAKDLLANFFGGLTIFLDRPFSVGDWVGSPDRDIEGVVEHIGWRQTTIRKFDRRPLYVPNAVFTTITVENPSRMTHRRIHEIIGIRYDDIEQMPVIVNAVRDMLTNHPEIDQQQSILVYFNAFSRSSIDFFVYCFTRTIEWEHYHVVKQDVLVKISQIVIQHGAEFAFPTSTVKVAPAEAAGGQLGANQ